MVSDPNRLIPQLEFLSVADSLKLVERGNRLADGSRRENSAEHSWHVCLMAMVLVEHCDLQVDLARVIQMLIVHDLVEVYAGDTLLYDDRAMSDKELREELAANRLYDQLPADQAANLQALWREFEAGTTEDSQYARAVDAFAPTWLHWGRQQEPKPENLAASTILDRKRPTLQSCPSLLAEIEGIVADAQKRGLIR